MKQRKGKHLSNGSEKLRHTLGSYATRLQLIATQNHGNHILIQDMTDTPSPKSEGKSLQECKNEVARKYNKENWFKLFHSCTPGKLVEYCDEAAELYASQPLNPWVSVEDRLPAQTPDYVLAISKEFNSIRISGGNDLRRNPNNFTHWMPLPAEPQS